MTKILYESAEANALTASEKNEPWRHEAETLKANLILEHGMDLTSLLDIGCGWGQTLQKLVGRIPILAGVDQSPDRIASLQGNQQNIKTYLCTASSLNLEDQSFDAVLMSHILHEILLFGAPGDSEQTYSEVKRVLRKKGAFFIIDHRDPGEGLATIDIGPHLETLEKFRSRFRQREISYQRQNNLVEMSTRDCHDFITKIWCLDQGAEDLEMDETHTVINSERFAKDLESNGFAVEVNIPFNPITDLMSYYGIKLVKGDFWGRQIFVLARSA